MRGPVVGLGQHHPGQQGADPQLAVPHPDGQHGLDPRRDAGGVDDLLEHRQRDHRRPVPPSSRTASASPPGCSPATRSPSRWEQLIPAACMNVASPSSSAASASQVARSRLVSSRGSPPPPSSAVISGLVDVPPAGIGPAADQPGPGEPGRSQQPGVVAGQHRHHAGAAAPDLDHDAARAAQDVAAAHVAQASADQPGAGSQADQPRGAHPPLRGGLGAGQREEAVDLRRAVGRLGPLPGQRHIRRIQLRDRAAGDEPLVGAQRAARHPGQPRRAPGEPLDHRRVEHHLRLQGQTRRGRVVREARRPQQVLRPLPPAWHGQRHDLPGERRRLR